MRCALSLQATLPGDQDEAAPLIHSNGKDSGTYGSHSAFEDDLSAKFEEDDEPDGDDEVMRKGRYTPVSNSFNKTSDKVPKRAFELPHKDYDVSDSVLGVREEGGRERGKGGGGGAGVIGCETVNVQLES